VNFDANLPAASAGTIFNRTFQLPDGTTFTTPYLAFITRTAGGTNININSYRPNPAFGAITEVQSIGETWYRAMFVELRKRLSNNLQFGLSYTFAKAENLVGTDNGGGTGSENAFGGATVIDQFSPLENGRARSPLDQRHRFVANAIYNFPKLTTGSEAFNSLINGFRISGIFTADGGRPFPTTVTAGTLSFILAPGGATFNGFGGLLGQGGAGTLLPTVPRNNNTGEANYKLDMRLARDISITERFKLELIGEAFNIFNRSNFNGFNTVIGVNNGSTLTGPVGGTTPPTVVLTAPSAPLGSPNNDAAPPDGTNARRFQVALRFRF